MTERCSARFLPRLERLPPASAPSPVRRLEACLRWQDRLTALQQEYAAVRSLQLSGPLGEQELEEIRQIYLDAMERCRCRAAACAPPPEP